MADYTISAPAQYESNVSGILVPAGTTATKVADLTQNRWGRLLAVVVDISAFTSGTLTLVIAGKTTSGYAYPLLSPSALGATGVTTYRVGVGLTASAGLTVNDLLPPFIEVTATVSGGGSLTYGIDYVLGR